jgi:hypothetical protein
MASFCGWPYTDDATFTMEIATYTLYPERHWEETRALNLGQRWMGPITSVHVDDDWAYGADTLVDSDDIVTDNRRGLLWLKPSSTSAWSTKTRANRVILNMGFAVTPPDVVALAAAAVRHLWDLGFDQGVAQVSHGNLSASKDQGRDDHLLPASVRNGLTPYVNWSSRVG